MHNKASSGPQPPPPRPSLAHFAIFNPDLPPPTSTSSAQNDTQNGPVDKDLEDDLAQAAQIVFYTSSEGGTVSRDKMLRQVGLVKGLMSFTSVVAPTEADAPWWSVHSHKGHMVVYTADGYHFYLNVRDAAGLSDRMVVQLLRRAYEDYCLLHSPMPPANPPHASADKFYTRFTHDLSTNVLAAHPSATALETWLGGLGAPHADAVGRALDVLAEDISSDDAPATATRHPAHWGVIAPGQAYRSADPALTRYLHSLLRPASFHRSRAREALERKGKGKTDDARERKVSGWSAWPFTRTSTPVSEGAKGSDPTSAALPASAADREEGAGKWLGLGTISGAMGSMGTVFGIKGGRTASGSAPSAQAAVAPANGDGKTQVAPGATDGDPHLTLPEGASGRTAASPAVSIETREQGESEERGNISVSNTEAERADIASLVRTTDAEPDADKLSLLTLNRSGPSRPSTRPASIITAVDVALPELVAAQADPDPAGAWLAWDSKRLWVRSGEAGTGRAGGWKVVKWIVRDDILLYYITAESPDTSTHDTTTPSQAHHTGQPDPPAGPVLALFNRLAPILGPSDPFTHSTRLASRSSAIPGQARGSFDLPRPAGGLASTLRAATGAADVRSVGSTSTHTPDSRSRHNHTRNVSGGGGAGGTGTRDTTVYKSRDDVEVVGDEMDVGGVVLAELKDTLERNQSIREIYARTSASRFVVAKRYPKESGRGPSGDHAAAATNAELPGATANVASSAVDTHSQQPTEPGPSAEKSVIETVPDSITDIPVPVPDSNSNTLPLVSESSGARRAGDELYMLVGRKDASLVDADYAVRAFERAKGRR